MLNIEVEDYNEMNEFMREQKTLFFVNLIKTQNSLALQKVL